MQLRKKKKKKGKKPGLRNGLLIDLGNLDSRLDRNIARALSGWLIMYATICASPIGVHYLDGLQCMQPFVRRRYPPRKLCATALDRSFFIERGIYSTFTNNPLSSQLDWFKAHLNSTCSSQQGVNGTLDLHDPRVLAMAAAQRQFLEAKYDDYAGTNGSGAAFCRSATLIFMALLLLRHALVFTNGDEEDDDVSVIFSLFLLRVAGFLLPCYIMAWAISILQRRRQRQIVLKNLDNHFSCWEKLGGNDYNYAFSKEDPWRN